MDTELHRAMTELGNPPPRRPSKTSAQKPYFLSYSVADAENMSITAQYGAITGSRHEQAAPPICRSARLARRRQHARHAPLHRAHHRPAAAPDDRAAIERSLWFATNRGYGKALDALEKVKTEQQVRAKEEDSSADFSTREAGDGNPAPRDAARRRPRGMGVAPA